MRGKKPKGSMKEPAFLRVREGLQGSRLKKLPGHEMASLPGGGKQLVQLVTQSVELAQNLRRPKRSQPMCVMEVDMVTPPQAEMLCPCAWLKPSDPLLDHGSRKRGRDTVGWQAWWTLP